MPPSPLVSIIVRARDEAPALRRLLPLLVQQECDFSFEIWLLDNSSTDESTDLACKFGAKYHNIPRDEFNYSTALNIGAALANGEIVVHLSAHCYPQSLHWLAQLIAPLQDHQEVIATYGRQWIDPVTSPFESQGNVDLFPEMGEPQVIAFSNANCAIRKRWVLSHPFNPVVRILEDHLFWLELAGCGQFVYVPGALVHHDHDHFSWRYYLRRWWREGWALYFVTEYRGLPSPFRPQPMLHVRNLCFTYPYLAAAFFKRGAYRTALITLPFFWLRDFSWLIAFRVAATQRAAIARDDEAFRSVALVDVTDQVS
jgi:glycosyltransferase involved in cell wall biosynthesis